MPKFSKIAQVQIPDRRDQNRDEIIVPKKEIFDISEDRD